MKQNHAIRSSFGIENGQRVIVIGGSGGIGFALCQHLIEVGAHVASADTSNAIADRGAAPGSSVIQIDVTSSESVATAASEAVALWGGVDAVIYVSGVGEQPTPVSQTSDDQWDRLLNINLRGAFMVAREFGEIIRRCRGSFVFISSGLATNVEPGFGAYSASKAGLIAFSKVLAKELAPEARVNVVAPGMVQTPFLYGGTGEDRKEEPSFAVPSKPDTESHTSIPLRRIAQPEDVIGAILFLAGTGAQYITGQTIYVNGGRFMP